MRIDPKIIDALCYVQTFQDEDSTEKQKKYYPELSIAPLSKAVLKDNKRCVALLLKYMSNTYIDISPRIMDLFPKLIDQNFFPYFLAKMTM
jgi:hypothetical protein